MDKVKVHDFKFKVIGIALIVSGVSTIIGTILESKEHNSIDKRLKALETASAGYGEHISYLFEKISKMEENR